MGGCAAHIGCVSGGAASLCLTGARQEAGWRSCTPCLLSPACAISPALHLLVTHFPCWFLQNHLDEFFAVSKHSSTKKHCCRICPSRGGGICPLRGGGHQRLWRCCDAAHVADTPSRLLTLASSHSVELLFPPPFPLQMVNFTCPGSLGSAAHFRRQGSRGGEGIGGLGCLGPLTSLRPLAPTAAAACMQLACCCSNRG